MIAAAREKVAPRGPPYQWCGSFNDPQPYDVVTGDPHIDKQIAINRGLYPKPWWRKASVKVVTLWLANLLVLASIISLAMRIYEIW